jgi:head-tail adaptor
VRAGSLNRWVTLLRRGAPVDNGYEQVPGEWAGLGRRRASAKPVAQAEAAEGAGVEARRGVTFWLRADTLARSLTATDAVLFDGRIYELTGEPAAAGARLEMIELIGVGGAAFALDPAPGGEGWALHFDDANVSGLVVLLEDI